MFWMLVPPGLAPGLGVGSVMVCGGRLLFGVWSVALASGRGFWAPRWPSGVGADSRAVGFFRGGNLFLPVIGFGSLKLFSFCFQKFALSRLSKCLCL